MIAKWPKNRLFQIIPEEYRTTEYSKASLVACPVCFGAEFHACISHRDGDSPTRHEAHRLRVVAAAKLRLAFKKGTYTVKRSGDEESNCLDVALFEEALALHEFITDENRSGQSLNKEDAYTLVIALLNEGYRKS